MEGRSRILKGVNLALVLSMFLTLINLAQVQASEISPALLTAQKTVSYKDITFSYDASLANKVIIQTVPEVTDNIPAGPEHFSFTFEGYPAGSWGPEISVYEVAKYNKYWNDIQANPDPATELKKILSQKPSLTNRSGIGNGIPFLTPVNAAQRITAKASYLPFVNGEGVAYIAFFTQAVGGFNGDGLIYTFQGVSNDGKYYISAEFPISIIGSIPPPPPLLPLGEEPQKKPIQIW